MAKIEEIIKAVESMTVVEINDLVKALEEKFGVSAAAAVVAGPAAAGDAPAAVEEKTEFNVVLKEMGGNKIAVIKAIREVTGLGLMEAKNLVESAPSTVKENVPVAEANKIVAALKEAGATAELQ